MCRMPLSLCRDGTGYSLGAVRCHPPSSNPHILLTAGLDSHKAKGTVGDEEQLLPVGHQAAQDCKRLVSSQDVLL